MPKIDFSKKIGFGKIAFASVFLFNPYFGFIDVLPDFIGIALLYFVVSSLSAINGYFSQALYNIKKMLYISVARFAVSCVVVMNGGSLSDSTLGLLYSFSFSILYLIFALPVFSKLRDGMNHFTLYGECKTIQKGTEFIYRFSVLFLISHCVLSALPEFAVLFKPDELALPDKSADIFYNMGKYRLIAIIAVTVIGFAWLLSVCIYFLKIKANKDFISALCDTYDSKGYNIKESITESTLKAGLLMIACGIVFSFNFFFENVNILPSFISCIFIIWGIGKLSPFVSQYKKIKLLSLICAAVSFAKFVLEIIFTDKFSYTQIFFKPEATELFWFVFFANVLDSLLYLAVSLLSFEAIKEIIKNHAGFLPSGENNERINLLHKNLINRIKVLSAFAILKCFTSIYVFVEKIIENKVYTWDNALAFPVDVAVSAVYVFFAALVVKVIIEEISARYMISH